MSTGYGWEGLRQVRVCATLLGVRHVPEPERLCGGLDYLGRYNKCSALHFVDVVPRVPATIHRRH